MPAHRMNIARCCRRVLLALSIPLAACGGRDSISLTRPIKDDGMSAEALAYLNRAVDTMQHHSINRYRIAWDAFRQSTINRAGNAQTTADTYDAIRYAIDNLGDHHSFFQEPGQAGSAPASAGRDLSFPTLVTVPSSVLDGDVGYLVIGSFAGPAEGLATSYQQAIREMDTSATVCGWVIDLRENLGGNMWPMLAGAGPILGEGVLGYFVDPDSVVQTWTYEAGSSRLDGEPITLAANAYTLRAPGPPVAVLQNGHTASSGEAALIAFRGRADSRTFGQPSWGVSTANAAFTLSDGATLVLTVSTMADRTGQLYGSTVRPDEQVEGAVTRDPSTDAVLAAAVDWVHQHDGCGAASVVASGSR